MTEQKRLTSNELTSRYSRLLEDPEEIKTLIIVLQKKRMRKTIERRTKVTQLLEMQIS